MADINGAFKLEVSPGDVLEASYIGYNPQQVKVGSQTRFQFVLEEVANTLDDIVVVGYSSQKKRNGYRFYLYGNHKGSFTIAAS